MKMSKQETRIVINPWDFGLIISDELRKAAMKNVEIIHKIIEEEAKNCAKILKLKSPKGKTENYSKGWVVRKSGRVFTILNKNKPWLTHILEKGAIRAKRGILPPMPHISPAYEETKKNIKNRLGGN